MARTQAVLPGGARLSDYLSVGVIAQIFPLPAVRAALDECSRRSQRQRSLPAEVMGVLRHRAGPVPVGFGA